MSSLAVADSAGLVWSVQTENTLVEISRQQCEQLLSVSVYGQGVTCWPASREELQPSGKWIPSDVRLDLVNQHTQLPHKPAKPQLLEHCHYCLDLSTSGTFRLEDERLYTCNIENHVVLCVLILKYSREPFGSTNRVCSDGRFHELWLSEQTKLFAKTNE